MTNAEKYEKIFGREPDVYGCPQQHCKDCPCNKKDEGIECKPEHWWNSTYKKPKEN